MMVGDVFPANVKYNEGVGVAARFFSHLGKPWKNKLTPLFEDADIVFANLEAPLIEDSRYAAQHTFAGCKEFAGFLSDIGINVVSIANNHILEQQPEGFYRTLQYLEESLVFWVGKQVRGMSNIKIFQSKGVRVGFVAFNAIHDIINPGLVADLHESYVLECIRKMKVAEVDICVISLHWGDEYVNLPSASQMSLAHRFIDAGADIIVGHHPHVVQPVESYKTGLIFYSLGNFIFDVIWSRNVRTGAMARVRVGNRGIEDYELVPVYLGNDYVPERLKGRRLERFFARQLHYKTMMASKGSRYEAYYNRKRKANRLWQRIAMKFFLLRNWRKIGGQARKQLGVNILKKMVKQHE